ncbi:MAG: hypothetical protein RIC80_12580 [Cyclobacteriaceae bacterium]
MKEFFRLVLRIYDFKIIAFFVVLLIVLRNIGFGFVPDFFDLASNLEDGRIALTLASSITGFFSLILVISLVFFNLLSLSVRRNATDFISGNIWLKRFLSIYLGVLFFLIGSFFSIQKPIDHIDLNLAYASVYVFFTFLITAFPLILTSLDHSVSLKRIKELILQISNEEIMMINGSGFHEDLDNTSILEVMESNKLIVLKDLGVEAIRRHDWSLPQNIVIESYRHLIGKIDSGLSPKEVSNRVLAWQFLIDELVYPATSENDAITVSVVADHLIKIHKELPEKSFTLEHFSSILETTNRFLRALINATALNRNQEFIQRFSTDIARLDFQNFNVQDEQLQLLGYSIENSGERKNLEEERDHKIYHKWHLLIHDSKDVFFNAMEYAIEQRNKPVYDRFQTTIHYTLDYIMALNNLSDYQKEEILDEYYHSGDGLIKTLIELNLFKDECIYSHISIVKWLKEERRFAIRALYQFSFFIKTLSKIDKLSPYLIDEFMMIARNMPFSDSSLRHNALQAILTSISEINEQVNKDLFLKTELKRQLSWLKDLIIRGKDEKSLQIFTEFEKKHSQLARVDN